MIKDKIEIKCKGSCNVALDELNDFQQDLKILTDDRKQVLKDSILKYGFSFPFIIWKDKKNKIWINDGHQRNKVLLEMKSEGYELPDKFPACEMFADNKKQAAEKILAQSNMIGKFADEGLHNYLTKFDIDIEPMNIELPNINFDKFNLKYFKGETEDDEVPEADEKNVICKTGDLWTLGKHRLLCGDATEKDDVEQLMGDNKIDMCFTDPPYGVGIGDKNKLLDTIQKAERIKTNIKNDRLKPDELKEMLTCVFINIKSISNDLCSYFVTAPQGGGLGMMMMMMKDAGLPVRHVIIWVKNRQCFSFGRLDYEYKHEPILYTWNKRHKFYGNGQFKSSVWNIDKEQKCDKHPTMKPVELIENAILNNSINDNIVADMFLGSGSTLIACEKTNRKCYGMEIEPYYCDVIIGRWENYTGNKAKLIGNYKKTN